MIQSWGDHLQLHKLARDGATAGAFVSSVCVACWETIQF